MNDDVLLPFIEAYRAEHSARSLDAQALRRRVATAGRGRSRRVERLRMLLPLAATLAGSIALAASPPARQGLREVVAFVWGGVAMSNDAMPRSPVRARAPGSQVAPVVAQPERDAPSGTMATPAAPAAPRVAAPVALPAVALAPPRATAVVPATEPPAGAAPVASFPVDSSPPVAASRPAPAKASVPAPPAASVAASPPNADLALYRQAHALHFSGGDRSLTLAAWDAYLRTFPRGTFAPEARLNRAVCLAQLGRQAEAERVLSDIERGRFGRDGRGQAKKLLEALDEE